MLGEVHALQLHRADMPTSTFFPAVTIIPEDCCLAFHLSDLVIVFLLLTIPNDSKFNEIVLKTTTSGKQIIHEG